MLTCSMIEGELADLSSNKLKEVGPSPIKLIRKQFSGRYAISSEEFTGEMVRLAKWHLSLCFQIYFLPLLPLIFSL